MQFTLQASVEGRVQGTLQATGRMQHGGEQLQFALTGDGRAGPENSEQGYGWHVRADVVVAGENEVYLAVHELSTDPPDALLPPGFLQGLLGQWWRLPQRAAHAPAGITPDPKLLTMQTEVIDVARDRGIETHLGRQAYHYDTTINREKLLQFLEEVARERKEPPDRAGWEAMIAEADAQGQLWIDTETFFVLGLQWTITAQMKEKPLHIAVQMELSDVNAAPPIEPPSDARPLPFSSLESETDAAEGNRMSPLPVLPGL